MTKPIIHMIGQAHLDPVWLWRWTEGRAEALATSQALRDEDMGSRARIAGERFRSRFQATTPANVRELRQLGLMIGIELKEKARPHLIALMERGVLALPAGPTVIRLLPPLVITDQQIDTVVDHLHAVLAQKNG